MSKTDDADRAPVHAIVMPSVGDMRNEVDRLLSLINQVELAQAIQRGDRISSYAPFTDWLKEADRGDLYVRQMAEGLLWEISEQGDKEEMAKMVKQATSYLSKM